MGADLSKLWLLHWPKGASGAGRLPPAAVAHLAGTGLFLDTCLRQLCLGLAPRPALDPELLATADVLAGESAWRFALEVATGLRSAVPGETNVFGQIKSAWAAAPLPPERRRALARIVDGLFADTRQLRRQHLQGVGGASYGSLARRLLKPSPGDSILLVGTGSLARSLLPFLDDFDVGAWNHRPAPLVAAAPDDGSGPRTPRRWFQPGEAEAAAAWARHVIFTTPVDGRHDGAWLDRLREPARSGRLLSILHLGRRRSDALAWPPGIRALHLDDLFDLASHQESLRSRQLVVARKACAELAAARAAPARHPLTPGAAPALLAHG